MRKSLIGAAALVAAAAVVGLSFTTGPTADAALSLSAIPSQTVQATVQPNPSQAVAVPVPSDADLTTLPLVTSDNPNLMVQGTAYSADKKTLVVSAIDADPDDAVTGTLTVAGWGTYPATVQPNPSQLVTVALPPNYDTTKLPTVTSQSSDLILIGVSYSHAGTTALQVDLGNPSPTEPATGTIKIDW